MKIRILFVLCFLCGNLHLSYSQPLKTKDGEYIGERSEFMTQCLSSGQTEINLNGIVMDLESYCSCTCDRLLPEINSGELMKAFQTGKTTELFLQDKYFKILTACFEKNFERSLDKEIEYKHHNKVFSSADKQREFEVNQCVKEVLSSQGDHQERHYDTESAKVYCNCAIERLYKGGYSYDDIKQIDDLNSAMFNEIILPCSSLALEIDESISESNVEIIGNTDRTTVPLVEGLYGNHKIKISIGGISKYYTLVNSGTYLCLDSSTERELLLEGKLKKSNYVESAEHLVNGETMHADLAVIDNIKIGGFTLNNVKVVFVHGSESPLCGNFFLNNFRKWEIDQKNNQLILYK